MDEGNQTKRKHKGGRKPKADPAIYRYGFKLNATENARFISAFLQSGLDEKSRFIKALIFNRELKVVKIDKSTKDYYIRLTNFYGLYQAIGVNYNQIVKALKTNFGEKPAIALLHKLEKATIELVVLSKLIIQLTKEYEAKYLQNNYK